MPEEKATSETEGEGRWELIRDVLVFQVKLAADALRDLVLSPVSLGAAVLDLLSSGRERPYFYRVLSTGRRTETWIDLFAEADRIEPRAEPAADRATIDRVVRRVEALLVDQVERGGVTSQAKATIDRSLDALSGRRRPAPRAGDSDR